MDVKPESEIFDEFMKYIGLDDLDPVTDAERIKYIKNSFCYAQFVMRVRIRESKDAILSNLCNN